MPLHNAGLARRAKQLLNGIAGELSALATAGKSYSLDRTRAFGGLHGRVRAAVDCLSSLPLALAAPDLERTFRAAEEQINRIACVHLVHQQPASYRGLQAMYAFPAPPTDDAEYKQLQEQLWRVFIDAAIEAQRVAAELAESLVDDENDRVRGGKVDKQPQVDKPTLATAILFQEPEIDPDDLAKRIGVARTTLYSRSPKWDGVRRTLMARDKGRPIKGTKSADGELEAAADYREFHPTNDQ